MVLSKIEKIEVSLEPWVYSQLGDYTRYELRVRVKTGKEEYTQTMILEEDDLESRFEFTFDRAREIVRRELKKQSQEACKKNP